MPREERDNLNKIIHKLITEKWAKVRGYEDQYIIFADGAVLALSQLQTWKQSLYPRYSGYRFLQAGNENGRLYVNLHKNTIRKRHHIDTLIHANLGDDTR